MPVLASERRLNVQPGHPLYEAPCPVCDGLLGETATVLVFAGIEPQDRKPGGYTTGAAVAVHAFCAGVPGEEPEALTADAGVTCADLVGSDDDEDGPRPCGKPSRFTVSRSDRDTSFGSGGGTEEACEGHLAGVVAGMVAGDDHVRAVVTIRWDKPEAAATAGEDGS